jgi:SAM-dependent methyltransferase
MEFQMCRQSSDIVCAFCDSTRLAPIIDFGNVALAGAFLRREDFATERLYPLRVQFCRDCFAVQVSDIVPPNVMFENYFYFSSSIGTLREHFQRYAAEIKKRFFPRGKGAVLEIGCNDGVLLRPLAEEGIERVIGVDPARNVVATIADPRITVINDYFTESVARKIVFERGKVDLVIANNVYAHIPNIQDATRAVVEVLAEDGVFAFEVHYLGKVIDELQYDMIYHEHLYYYSLISLINHFRRYGMMIFDLEFIPIHAGSVRFYACKQSSKWGQSVSAAVKRLEREELEKGLNQYETFLSFSASVERHRTDLLTLLSGLRSAGHRVAGYGASGRANTIIQYCGLGRQQLEFMVDDAPAKVGMYTPKSHLEIKPRSSLLEDDSPDYVLVFAWSFLKEIRERNCDYLKRGGKMIVPLPEVRVLSL